MVVPSSTALIELFTKIIISFVALALSSARLLTSSATTANPFPASPALAASIAAFKERRLFY